MDLYNSKAIQLSLLKFFQLLHAFFNFLVPISEGHKNHIEPGASEDGELNDDSNALTFFEDLLQTTGKLHQLSVDLAKMISRLQNKQILQMPGDKRTKQLPQDTAQELAIFRKTSRTTTRPLPHHMSF